MTLSSPSPRPAPLARLEQITRLSFPQFMAPGRILTVYESGTILPFPAARVFTVASDTRDSMGGCLRCRVKKWKGLPLMTLSSPSPRPAPLARLEQITRLSFPQFMAPGRILTVYESGTILPFPAARVFTVASDTRDSMGGGHAHRWCSQVLVCLQGSVEFIGRDHQGGEVRHFLDRPEEAILMPPTIWGEQYYRDTPALLLVFCDYTFDPDDYIRDFELFRAYRAALVERG